jgi:ATP-dependent Clp protease protease subunit
MAMKSDNPSGLPQGVRIMAKGSQAAEITVYGLVGDSWLFEETVTAKGFRDEIKALGDVQTLTVRINSDGGSVQDGLAIFNTLKQHPAKKIVEIDGYAGSIASIIAMSGDEIRMGEGARMMIHDPAAGVGYGNSTELRKLADLLDAIREDLVGIYTKRTGQPAPRIRDWMASTTWFSADEARLYGFADA